MRSLDQSGRVANIRTQLLLGQQEEREQGGWLGHQQCLPGLELLGGIGAEK